MCIRVDRQEVVQLREANTNVFFLLEKNICSRYQPRETKLVIFPKGIYDPGTCRTGDIFRGKSLRSHNGPAT